MARPEETDEDNHRWTGAIRTCVLFALTLGVLAYLWLPGRQASPARDIGEFCSQMKQLDRFDESLADLDPNAARDAIPSLDRLQAVAPADILQAVNIIVDTSRSLVEPVKQAQSDEEVLTDTWRAMQPDVARIQSAGKALTTYVADKCGMDLSPTTSTSQAAPQAAPTSVATTPPPTTASTPTTTAKAPAKTQTKAPAKTTPTSAAPRRAAKSP